MKTLGLVIGIYKVSFAALSLTLLHANASIPYWRMRLIPVGNTRSKKRRKNSSPCNRYSCLPPLSLPRTETPPLRC